MRCDKWFEMGKLGFCLILFEILRIGEEWIFNNIKNLSWCVDKSA